MANTLR